VDEAELTASVKAAREAYEAEPDNLMNLYTRAGTEYKYSMYVRGDNTHTNAVGSGALDMLELYPDYKPTDLEEYVRAFYAQGQE
jgi:hypothetical protein